VAGVNLWLGVGVRPLSLIRPSARLCLAAADSGSAGAGRGGSPSGDIGCVPCGSWRVTGCWPPGGQVAARASSPSSARMWQAWRTILRASDKAARLVFLRSATAA
jgi:hypothetical protein